MAKKTTNKKVNKTNPNPGGKKEEKYVKWGDSNNATLVRTLAAEKAMAPGPTITLSQLHGQYANWLWRGVRRHQVGSQRVCMPSRTNGRRCVLFVISSYMHTYFTFSAQTRIRYSERATQCIWVWVGPQYATCYSGIRCVEWIHIGEYYSLHSSHCCIHLSLRNTSMLHLFTGKAFHCLTKMGTSLMARTPRESSPSM